MSLHGRRFIAWCFASCFAVVQVVVSVQAVGHAMEHVRHDATPHVPVGCTWLHVVGESLETAADTGLLRVAFVTAVEVPASCRSGVLLPLRSCSRAPPPVLPD
ncbi:hypothetical protein [Nitrospira sp. Kam-Ns4a]